MQHQNLYQKTVFLQSAAKLNQCPTSVLAEVAFAGRSNVGKSSVINTLTNNKKLARTSKIPGSTRLINYFSINKDNSLVDLPGYGYAKVPLPTKMQWDYSLSEYLHYRDTLRGLVLLMDIRHPLQESDIMMLHWAIEKKMPIHILLTKSDKLKKGPSKNILLAVQQHLRGANFKKVVSVQLFSAIRNEGVRELVQVLDNLFEHKCNIKFSRLVR